MSWGGHSTPLVLSVWLGACLAVGICSGQEMQGPPDPLARDSPLRTGVVIGVLIVIATGALWLGRQSSQRPTTLARGEGAAGRTPDFSQELEKQQAEPENLRQVVGSRSQQQIVRPTIGEGSSGEEEL